MALIGGGTPLGYANADTPRAQITDLIQPPEHDRKLVWRWFFGLASVLLVVYAVLQNPYWVPGGDSDFYVAIARNLALEGKYEYNGLPVAISPPGWPWVMAAVLKVSPTFLALKLTTMLCMWGSLLIGYFIALRFAPPRVAALSVGLAGVLMPVNSLTYFLHSEGLYCLASAAAMLLAFRVREKRGRFLEAGLLVLMCVAIPLVRWAGVFQLLPIVAVLLSGRWTFKGQRRQWLLVLVCTVTIFVTWLGTRWSLELTAEQLKALKDAGGSSTMDTESGDEVIPTDSASVVVVPITTTDAHTIYEEYGQRFVRSGKWFSWLLWQPTRFAGPLDKWLDSGVSLLGWGVIGVLAYVSIARVIKGDLLWFFLAIYCGGLCLNWPNPNARYFVPVAPLIILGILIAIRTASDALPARSFDWGKWVRRTFVYSVLLCNVAMYGTDAIVMRSSRFYDDFEAGQHKDLVNIAHYLINLTPLPQNIATLPATTNVATQRFAPRDGEVMINERYENLGRIRFSKAGMRAMVLLTNVNIKPLDKSLSRNIDPVDPATSEFGKRFPTRMIKFVRRSRADWVLIQSPAIPWRVWHFRVPMEWYERFTKIPGRPPSGGWTLYRHDPIEGDLIAEPVPGVDGWPTRVPGM